MKVTTNATLSPARIAIGYAVVSILWITFSDTVFSRLGVPAVFLTLKGILFVLVTAFMLYLTIRSTVRAVQAASRERDDTATLYETLVSSSTEGICYLDENGEITSCNAKFAHLFQTAGESPVGRKLHDVLAESSKSVDEQFSIHSSGLRELQLKNRNQASWVLISSTRVVDRIGNARGTLALFLDISDRKRLETELRQSQKLEALGSFAGGITHDFNNLLSIISGYAAVLRGGFAYGTPEWSATAEILSACNRGSALVRQLLAFCRKLPINMETVEVCERVTSFAEVLPRIVGEHIRLTVDCQSNTGWVQIGAGQLEQVLINLAANARDAMSNGGVLTVSTSRVEVGNEQAAVHRVKPAGYVQLRVTDTGCGIPSEIKPRIFEPFFTTKAIGVGTGLGLSTVYGIVVQNGGFVTCESALGVGTTFCIFLPAISSPARSAEVANRFSSDKVTGTETVLLVEDEQALRALSKHILSTHGYHVFEASDGLEALRIAQSADRRIDLVLTDIVMPGMGGVELARRLTEVRPDTTVVFMSGYSDVNLDSAPGSRIIQKPVAPDDLLKELRVILDQPRRPHQLDDNGEPQL